MKKLIYATVLTMAVFTFQACGGGSGTATDTSDTSEMATDSMDKTAMSVDQMDIDFASKAALGGMAEVELGKLAQDQASNSKVKEFATMMVTDHSKANGELMSIANAKSITLPAALDEEHQKKYDELKSKSGSEFDKAYVAAMVEGHQKTLALIQDGAQHCKDSALKGFAEKTAPVVKAHLDLITKIQAELK